MTLTELLMIDEEETLLQTHTSISDDSHLHQSWVHIVLLQYGVV